jgi:hypothetical protein
VAVAVAAAVAVAVAAAAAVACDDIADKDFGPRVYEEGIIPGGAATRIFFTYSSVSWTRLSQFSS